MFQKRKLCRLQTLIRLLEEQPYLGLQFAQVGAVSICRVKVICFWLLYDKGYRKNSKNWDTLNYYRDCPTNVIVGFYSAILRSEDADRITNRVDTDQNAP